MLLIALLAAATPQDAASATTATVAAPDQASDGTQRWSILVQPCVRDPAQKDEVLICAKLPEPPPPLPNRPMPSNPNLDGMGAFAAASSPCATESRGCNVGVDIFGAGTALVRLAQKIVSPGSCCEEPGEGTNVFKLAGDVVSGVGKGFKKKPDKSKRVPILFDDLPPEKPATKAEEAETAPQG